MNDAKEKTETGLATDTQPGRLEGSRVKIVLHTLEANGVLQGRYEADKPRIVGLREFNIRAGIVFEAAARDDPFADQALLNLETAFKTTEERFHSQLAETEQEMRGRTTISEGHSRKPAMHRLRLARYGTQAADLIALYDELVLRMRNALHHNRLAPVAAYRAIDAGRRSIRAVFGQLAPYRVTGVTREDLAQKNQRAQLAVLKLVESGFLDLAQYGGAWNRAAEAYATYDDLPEFGPSYRRRVGMEQPGVLEHPVTVEHPNLAEEPPPPPSALPPATDIAETAENPLSASEGLTLDVPEVRIPE